MVYLPYYLNLSQINTVHLNNSKQKPWSHDLCVIWSSASKDLAIDSVSLSRDDTLCRTT